MDIAGLQLLAGALGLTMTVVFLDSAAGFVRDHPPLSWRCAGMAAGPLALLSLAVLLGSRLPCWLCLSAVLPFAAVALIWSYAWYRRRPAEGRRRRGREAAIIGVITLLFVGLEQPVADSGSALAPALFAGSAALLGGLGMTLLTALLGNHRADVAVRNRPYGIPARVVAIGLGITLLACLNGGVGLLFVGSSQLAGPVAVWLLCSLLLPLALVGAGHGLFPRWQPSIWAVALASVVIGQAALQSVLLVS